MLSRKRKDQLKKAQQKFRDNQSYDKLVNQLSSMDASSIYKLVNDAGWGKWLRVRTIPYSNIPTLASYPQWSSMSPHMTASFQVALGLSKRKMDLARRAIPGMFASRDKVNEWLKAQATSAKLINMNGISMTMVSLKLSIASDIRNVFSKDPKLKARTHHIIKIGGDGTTDIREKNAKIRTILVLAYAYCDIGNVLAERNHGVIATAWVKESINSIHAMAKQPNSEIIDLINDGMDIDGVHHSFKFYLCGDMKWLRMAYGLNGCGSAYCCPHCIIKRNQLDESYESEAKLTQLVHYSH